MKTNFMGKCYAGMNSMVTGMKCSNLNWKQDGKAAEAEKTIHTMTREIGNLTVVMLDGDRSVGPDIKERYSAILEARKLMAEADKLEKYLGPHCGKKSSVGMHYCGWCGEALADGALIAEVN